MLTKTVYGLTGSGEFLKDRGVRDQLQRASTSIMTNIAEGFDSGSNAEFLRFLSYARRSASELQSILYIACDQDYITETQFKTTYLHAEKIRKMVTALSVYLRTHRKSGQPTRQPANSLTR